MNRRRSDALVLDSLILLVLIFAIVLTLAFGREAQDAVDAATCTTDTDCHQKHPGLCPDDRPYCF
jgi:hypothetical protein